ncbi:tRNA (adenosine(37)-N6)-threonylcarbamoyltransferase complex ATPase subunit type 1 TsaE [Alkalibacterium sp. 20]|uniref:tRNA (adenosine(37)-N6)-threonylcarbamoyltransferase complex ATPase subunit type 1 TsaE n=1 Tax=Alkalibacterium sp. 20 TaxID=1798803 RepID=UPI000900312D|nr:tRNA (adenosine(37)-N6)-threonylcarbamoyltransferase complex ATPase subunit type 1 TsaE [Alkalibacterium sp. 20]OJF93069.1 tRNA threonylcarbamoyladenosine biosynthesis protein TsaE [Alkalibacterium sp. 20]
MKIITKNEQETKMIAKKLATLLKPSMTVLLEGQLGAGKTTFTKGVAEGLGIKRIIKSPTYTLIKEYTDGDLPLYHMDLYRLEDAEDEELGLEEYFFGEGITIVEWGSFMKEELPAEHLLIEINVLNDSEQRELIFKAHGKKYTEIVERLENE